MLLKCFNRDPDKRPLASELTLEEWITKNSQVMKKESFGDTLKRLQNYNRKKRDSIRGITWKGDSVEVTPPPSTQSTPVAPAPLSTPTRSEKAKKLLEQLILTGGDDLQLPSQDKTDREQAKLILTPKKEKDKGIGGWSVKLLDFENRSRRQGIY